MASDNKLFDPSVDCIIGALKANQERITQITFLPRGIAKPVSKSGR
jgi:hypothetical protein